MAGQLVGERRRRLVEEVDVVDEQRHRPVIAPLGDGPGDVTEHLGPVDAAHQVGQQRSEGAERQPGCSLGRRRPQRHEPGGRRRRQALGGQARLADTGRPGQDDAVGTAPQQGTHPLQLRGAPHQWPVPMHGRSVSHSRRGRRVRVNPDTSTGRRDAVPATPGPAGGAAPAGNAPGPAEPDAGRGVGRRFRPRGRPGRSGQDDVPRPVRRRGRGAGGVVPGRRRRQHRRRVPGAGWSAACRRRSIWCRARLGPPGRRAGRRRKPRRRRWSRGRGRGVCWWSTTCMCCSGRKRRRRSGGWSTTSRRRSAWWPPPGAVPVSTSPAGGCRAGCSRSAPTTCGSGRGRSRRCSGSSTASRCHRRTRPSWPAGRAAGRPA